MGIEVFGELFKEGRYTLNDLRLLEINIIENYIKTKHIPYNPYLDIIEEIATNPSFIPNTQNNHIGVNA